jgi:hypothetical protein
MVGRGSVGQKTLDMTILKDLKLRQSSQCYNTGMLADLNIQQFNGAMHAAIKSAQLVGGDLWEYSPTKMSCRGWSKKSYGFVASGY